MTATNYDGLPENITTVVPPSSLVVTDASNTSPVVITTSTTHNLFEGGYAAVLDVVGNLGANGVWKVHVTGVDTFEAVGSVGTGAYVSGGVVNSCALPEFPIPSDGDEEDVVSVNVTFEQIVDTLAALWLGRWAGHVERGGTLLVQGIIKFLSTGIAHFTSGSEANFDSGSFISGNPKLKSGSVMTFAPGSEVVQQAPYVKAGTTAKTTLRRDTIGVTSGTVTLNFNDNDIWDIDTLTGDVVIIPSLVGIADGDCTTFSHYPDIAGGFTISIQDGAGHNISVYGIGKFGFADVVVTSVGIDTLWKLKRRTEE